MGDRRGLTGLVLDFMTASWVAARVVVLAGIALGIFFGSFVLFFTVPFVFVAIALALLGLTAAIRYMSRMRAWLRSLRGAGG